MALPIIDISRSERVEKGYVLETAVYSARVIFPSSEWKKTLGGPYLLDPGTGASLQFYGNTFGRQFKTFLIWGYTGAEHQWARVLNQIANSDEKHARFLKEWIERALHLGQIQPPNSLNIVIPVVQENKNSAVVHPLRLDPPEQSVNIQQMGVGTHQFTFVEVKTKVDNAGQARSFYTGIYITGLHYRPSYDDWQFFVAFSHVPSELPNSKQEEIRKLFRETLSTLTLTPSG